MTAEGTPSMNTPTKALPALPPLPPCWTGSPVTVTWAEDGETTTREVYTAEQMAAYANAYALAAQDAALSAPQAGGRHRWQPDADIEGAVYCPRCDCTRRVREGEEPRWDDCNPAAPPSAPADGEAKTESVGQDTHAGLPADRVDDREPGRVIPGNDLQDTMVEAEPFEMAEALAEIAAALGCENDLDSMLDAIRRLTRSAGPQGEPVAWQVRTDLGGWWSGWSKVQSANEMEHMLGRYRELGQPAEGRALYTHPAGVDAAAIKRIFMLGWDACHDRYYCSVDDVHKDWVKHGQAALAPPAPEGKV